MKLSFFINRPVLAWVINLILVMVGAVCYFQLNVREYPQISYPIVTIEVKCPGFSAEIMEAQVTKSVEDSCSSIEGLKSISSSSSNDRSVIKLKFEDWADVNTCYVNVLACMQQLSESLPRHSVVKVSKADIDSSPVMYLVLYGDSLSQSALYDYSVKNLEKLFASCQGVANVTSYGGSIPEMHLILDLNKMNHYQISQDIVVEAVAASNVSRVYLGKFKKGDVQLSVNLKHDLSSTKQFDDMVVKNGHHGVIKLRDIGYAKMHHDVEKTRTFFNKSQCIILSIVAQPTSNPVAVSKDVHKKMESVRLKMPKGMKIDVAYDASIFVSDSIFEVYKSIIEAIILVGIVIILFLRSFRASLVPIIAIPLCLISTFAFIKFFGFSINVLTLLALVLAIGLLVDDAIVVVENIYRYMEKNKNWTPFKAAKVGFDEIQSAVISMTLTLIAVYLPITLYRGITAKLFVEFALTLSMAVLISGVVALTLSPMICARLLSSEDVHGNSGKLKTFLSGFTRFEEKIIASYTRFLDFVIHYRHKFALGIGVFSLSAVGIFFFLPTEFAKKEDMGEVYIAGLSPVGYTLDKIHPYISAVEDMLLQMDGVKSFVSGVQLLEESYVVVILDKAGRRPSSFEIANKLNDKFRSTPSSVQFYAYAPGGMLAGSGNKTASLNFHIQGDCEYDKLINCASSVIMQLASHEYIRNIDWDLAERVREYEMTINHEIASLSGIESIRHLGDVMYGLMTGSSVTTATINGKRYPVRVLLDDKYVESSKLFEYSVKINHQNKLGLTTIRNAVNLEEVYRTPEIKHQQGVKCITIRVDLKPGVSMMKAYNTFVSLVSSTLPDDIFISPSSDLVRIIEESSTAMLMFLLAIIFVFLIMAAQFESFVSPLIVMFTVPLALCGGIYTLFVVPGGSINMFSNIGFITLIGLITKHGILIVDFANRLVEQGMSIKDAISQSCLTRLRPILMTTFAMVIGSIPLVIATGPGSIGRQQLGWVIVGGMSIGTLCTLFFLPVIYIYLRPLTKTRKILSE